MANFSTEAYKRRKSLVRLSFDFDGIAVLTSTVSMLSLQWCRQGVASLIEASFISMKGRQNARKEDNRMQITSLVALSLPTGILNVGSFILPSIFIGTLVVNVINKISIR